MIHEADGDLYGDGVNSPPGLRGSPSRRDLRLAHGARPRPRQGAAAFRALGPRRVKNIAEPVEAYRVDLAGAPARRRHGCPRRASRGRRGRLLLVLGPAAAGGSGAVGRGRGRPSARQALDGRARLRQPQRRPGAGVLQRRDRRGDPHRARPLAPPHRHRPQLVLRLQGQGRRREAGRPRARRALPARGQRQASPATGSA